MRPPIVLLRCIALGSYSAVAAPRPGIKGTRPPRGRSTEARAGFRVLPPLPGSRQHADPTGPCHGRMSQATASADDHYVDRHLFATTFAPPFT